MAKILKLDDISQLIYIIRGQKVIFDFDLASLYQVENKALKRQVRSNLKRFPPDFMFQLTKNEWLKVVQNLHHLGKSKYTNTFPMVFTEQGVAMLSSVLRSERAVEMNIEIMRAFVKTRELMINNEFILKEIYELKREFDFKFTNHDEKISIILETIKRMLIEDEQDNSRKIGFDTGN